MEFLTRHMNRGACADPAADLYEDKEASAFVPTNLRGLLLNPLDETHESITRSALKELKGHSSLYAFGRTPTFKRLPPSRSTSRSLHRSPQGLAATPPPAH